MKADASFQLKHVFPGPGWRLGFHGSSRDFDRFTEAESVGQGADLNSSLGVHLALRARGAVHYAEQACHRNGRREPSLLAHVHLVAYRATASYEASEDEFFCRETAVFAPGHPLQLSDADLCDELVDPVGRFRQWLIDSGFSTLERPDVEGLGGHVIVLRPADTVVVATVVGRSALQQLAAAEAACLSMDLATRLAWLGDAVGAPRLELA